MWILGLYHWWFFWGVHTMGRYGWGTVEQSLLLRCMWCMVGIGLLWSIHGLQLSIWHQTSPVSVVLWSDPLSQLGKVMYFLQWGFDIVVDVFCVWGFLTVGRLRILLCILLPILLCLATSSALGSSLGFCLFLGGRLWVCHGSCSRLLSWLLWCLVQWFFLSEFLLL